MSRFLFAIAFLGLSLSCQTWGRSPNIVLMMADDMGYECVGVNGSTAYKTPRLDDLALKGMRFTNTFSTPICTPTRVQIMTGKYNFRNYTHFGYLNPQETTFAQLLKRAGYATCIAGKWQLNGIYHELPGNQDSDRPRAAGFDASCLWQVTRHKKFGERYADPLVEVNGEVLQQQVGKYGPDIFSDFVCDFIRNHKDRPFFCYYPMVLVHNPFVPTPDSPQWKTKDRSKPHPRFFADMVAYTDKIVGKVLDTLSAEGLENDTLFIFTADNGTNRNITTPTRSGPVRGGKGFTFETGIHVPMFAHWPGVIPAGNTCADLIDFTDFLPTLLETAAISLDPSTMDGRSFLPQLRGQRGDPRSWIFCHYDPRWGPMAKTPVRFVHDREYKLYHDGRFFHVKDDPLEQTALLAPPPGPAEQSRDQLQQALDAMPAWQRDTSLGDRD